MPTAPDPWPPPPPSLAPDADPAPGVAPPVVHPAGGVVPGDVVTPSGSIELAEAARLVHLVLDEVERAVIGKRDVLALVLAGLLADGHVLLEDLPGVAKTLAARSIATAAGLDFARVQFTPDLLPADITGALVLDPARGLPEFRPGPVFTNLLLADEINRSPAKTQAALLEAMQERQVTVDGTARPLPRPFLVVATQNPIESEGTYPLPEAQLDRFLVRSKVGYPSVDDEVALLERRVARGADEVALRPVVDAARFVAIQQAIERVHVDRRLLQYAVALVGATRAEGDLEVGASPRGSLALAKLARAWAVLSGRDYVGPDDLRAVAIPALAHRVVLRGETWVRGVPATEVVRRVVDRVPAPSTR
ncbi:MAG: AAA family ATPase [Acidimicrobiales bacterium]